MRCQRRTGLSCLVDQGGANAMPAKLALDPRGGNPWRELRTFVQIGCDQRDRAKKAVAGVGDQRQRYRLAIHVFAKTTADIVERMAVRLPPGLLDAVGHDIEKFGALAQIGDGQSKRH